VRVLDQTPACAIAKPRVSVILADMDHPEDQTREALESVAGSLYSELEVLILVHASSGPSAAQVERFLADHPSLPAALLHEPVNRGLAHSYNVLTKRARGDYLFILAPTGGVYPSAFQRLVTALKHDPQAIFSYSMVAIFDGDRSVELLSSLPWESERLKKGNWIDGMALIRRNRLLELRGYPTDPRLSGWEAFAFWCKCAEAGGHAVHVPQVLAWHRGSTNSTADNQQHNPAKWAIMRDLFPCLLAPSGTE
jgi:glycosyltransferase involved in cell wall biosynthesis